MARWIGPNRDINDVLAAAEAWRDRCFLGDGSVFGDEPLWTLENVRRVRELCPTEVEDTDAEAYARLTRQLTDATPQVVRLAAESVWLSYLFPTVQDVAYKRQRFLEHRGPLDRALFALRPDIVVETPAGPLVLDTKWKRLDHREETLGVDQSDVYQMLAYAHAYDAARLVLVYPWHAALGTPGVVRTWRIRGTCRTLHVATVDVGRPGTVVDALRRIVASRAYAGADRSH